MNIKLKNKSPNLAKKQWYQNIVLEQWGDAVFISLDELQELHRIHNPDYYLIIKDIIKTHREAESEYPCIAYVLGADIAAGAVWCCSGIRYGQGGDFTSLPKLPACVWN